MPAWITSTTKFCSGRWRGWRQVRIGGYYLEVTSRVLTLRSAASWKLRARSLAPLKKARGSGMTPSKDDCEIRQLLTLVGFGDDLLAFLGVVDIADDVQILVNFHGSAESAAAAAAGDHNPIEA
jgi:hypothetical protein